ncbi:hypothetical protein C8A05DRAFT_39253 [Staphylotrichum tortipilum]|uniref:Uncharacterized protein n=1 Tax=Staphylotrichum tortipilum TaxID=2831512 RepID=A0AAN6RP19_9PEZI|nr:hypothetical protein C8A05DRAFT_39253 [Staphylotrichum longicolle]
MDKLDIDEAFALGTSQDGWMATRMALLAPKCCWDPRTLLMPFYGNWCSATQTPDFVVDDV